MIEIKKSEVYSEIAEANRVRNENEVALELYIKKDASNIQVQATIKYFVARNDILGDYHIKPEHIKETERLIEGVIKEELEYNLYFDENRIDNVVLDAIGNMLTGLANKDSELLKHTIGMFDETVKVKDEVRFELEHLGWEMTQKCKKKYGTVCVYKKPSASDNSVISLIERDGYFEVPAKIFNEQRVILEKFKI